MPKKTRERKKGFYCYGLFCLFHFLYLDYLYLLAKCKFMEDRFTEAISAWPQIKQANYKRKKNMYREKAKQKKKNILTQIKLCIQ